MVGSSKFRFSYYITGILILLGVLLGRFICGFLCPFGWLQELLHKIPGKKLSTKKLRPLTYLKYVILLLAVVLLPALIVNDVDRAMKILKESGHTVSLTEVVAVEVPDSPGGLASVLEPILILVLAVFVGVILFATLLPIVEAGNVL